MIRPSSSTSMQSTAAEVDPAAGGLDALERAALEGAAHAPLRPSAPCGVDDHLGHDELEVGERGEQLGEEGAHRARARGAGRAGTRSPTPSACQCDAIASGSRSAHGLEVGLGDLLDGLGPSGRGAASWAWSRTRPWRRQPTGGPGPAHRRSGRPPAAPPSSAARTIRLPTITPSARSATVAACSPVEMPNPTATGSVGGRARCAPRAPAARGPARPARRWSRPARPRRRTRARRRRSRPGARAVVVGATSGTSAMPSASQAARSSPASSWGRSGTIRPRRRPAAARRA